MALKSWAMFGGGPAGPPWGWRWLYDMLVLWQARGGVTKRDSSGFEDVVMYLAA
jgi:hypothetical protein